MPYDSYIKDIAPQFMSLVKTQSEFIKYVQDRLGLTQRQINSYMHQQGFGNIVNLNMSAAEDMARWVKTNLGIDINPRSFWIGSLNNIRNRIFREYERESMFKSRQHQR